MNDEKITHADLRQFTGTENWHRHGVVSKALYTDGVKYLAERAGAYWLIDVIVFCQAVPAVLAEPFQVWTLRVDLSQATGELVCTDGNGTIVFKQHIPYTDFPLHEIRLYYIDNVLLLASEY